MKAVLDDDGFIIGVGETEETACADAVKSIMADEATVRAFVNDAVNGMALVEMTDTLRAMVEAEGGDAPYEIVSPTAIRAIGEA